MVITTYTALIQTMAVYRLAYMKQSGNRLLQCPDFVIHYSLPLIDKRLLSDAIAEIT
ncbi:Uncharacterised protein [Yersinia enterocolitica]|uniref:Uncharacterized protein n=3 Tax=Yersinia enterocolitica TaxID=630 RepID=A0A0T7P0D7_YEREN|nr:hypothetical protein DJ61_4285 [Yersinia enterocolitica]CFQ53656.1 Uncharacterised protein [Yersinia enterocolitica]CNB67577.1 Uncharacterised protein [Yersinia enterocolitica]CND54233.1 Uncharacterised protein [Yersinia enterocolitica]CNH81493.1 Uncharacterised protein [Yersinia enterocolitica]